MNKTCQLMCWFFLFLKNSPETIRSSKISNHPSLKLHHHHPSHHMEMQHAKNSNIHPPSIRHALAGDRILIFHLSSAEECAQKLTSAENRSPNAKAISDPCPSDSKQTRNRTATGKICDPPHRIATLNGFTNINAGKKNGSTHNFGKYSGHFFHTCGRRDTSESRNLGKKMPLLGTISNQAMVWCNINVYILKYVVHWFLVPVQPEVFD